MAGVEHRYGPTEVLAGIDLEVAGGETLALVGPSGCGKSTLLELIGGLRPLQAGTIAIGGTTAAAARTAASTWMPQRDLLLPWASAADNAALALRARGGGRAEARRHASRLLEHVGLGGFAAALPHELSGGMRQRVAFARTLLAGTPVLLLDEPFAALDAITRGELQAWLVRTLAEERRTTVLVTHDVEEALYVGDRVALMTRRPARVTALIDVPPAPAGASRAEAISDPAFVAARADALRALEEA
ncbi:MAG TPA: ATP-binding cassette domain-containing protein [Solirubrobacterales bacterium]|nr:ATP-binding cassette domain-containing protein [Solirubrobacterales bacterium]